MGLEFINIHTGEHQNISDLNAALALVKARDWAIKNPAVDGGSPAWEIVLSSAPMTGVYPRTVYDPGAFTPDNLNFYDQSLGRMFTLRTLLAAANTAPVVPPIIVEPYVPPIVEPYVPPVVVSGPGDALPPPVDTSGLWPGASTVPPPLLDYPLPPPLEPYVLPVDLKPGPPKLPWEVVPPVLYPVDPIYIGPGGPFLPYGPADPVEPPVFPWDSPFVPPDAGYKTAAMNAAQKWTVTLDPDGGIISTRAFPVRVVVDGRGRLVYSEAELSDALSNGGHIAGPDDNGNISDVVRIDIYDDFPDLPPKRIDYAAPAAGFPWWLLLVGAGLVLSKRKG